jgi:hypothetical protein
MNLLTIYLDFDGTVVEHAYPELGVLNPRSFAVIRQLQNAGHRIILNTYRADLADGSLQAALNFLNDINNELLPITECTELKIQPPAWNWEKTLEEGILYIDDVCYGTPMIPNIALPFGLMVDWKTLEEWFIDQGVI